MQAGKLNAEIYLLSKSATRNAVGGEVITWTVVNSDINDGKLCANAKPSRGREFAQNQQIDVEIAVMFTINYREDVLSTWRVLWRGHQYEIVGQPIDVNAQKRWLELMCKSAQPAV